MPALVGVAELIYGNVADVGILFTVFTARLFYLAEAIQVLFILVVGIIVNLE